MLLSDIREKARVLWTSGSSAGYCFRRNAAAVVVKVGPKRVRIRTAIKHRDGDWHPHFHTVAPESLSPRDEHVPAVDDYRQEAAVSVSATRESKEEGK